MATYAIGDIQGCFGTLQRLIAQIAFDPRTDRLWLVGDLVNRGPRSLEVLRWASGLGDAVVAVLGNHDLHLLARAMGVTEARPGDTLDEVLKAPDRNTLLNWLNHRPLAHREGGELLIHGGVLPQWSADSVEQEARAVEQALRADPAGLLSAWFAWRRAPLDWSPTLPPRDRVCAALSAFTTLRTCTPRGSLSRFDGSPEAAPPGYAPWFQIPERQSAGMRVIFGHWAALGLSQGKDWLGIDTGCVWGRKLTAIRLSDSLIFQENNIDPLRSDLTAP